MALASIPYRTFPELPFGLHTFGLFVALGVLAGILVARRLLGDRELAGAFERMAVRSVVWGLVGARLTWVVTHLESISSPLDVIAVWNGGLQFSGGFVVAVVAAMPTLRRQSRLARWQMLDAGAIGLAVGLMIGRIGCVSVGEHLGGPTDFLLGTRYLGGETIEGPLTVGVTYHNTAVYELLHLAVLAALAFWLLRRGVLRLGDGRAAGLFLGWYGVARFTTDTVRTFDERLLGLTGAQWSALLLLVPLGVALLIRSAARRPPDREPGPAVHAGTGKDLYNRPPTAD